MVFSHIPVFLNEAVDFLNIKPNGVYVDATAGGGGHSEAILEKLSNEGRLVLLDRDPDAVEHLCSKFKNSNNVLIIKDNFVNIYNVLYKIRVNSVDGILFDLGVSSYQLDNKDRGFTYKENVPLDMRMSKEGISAKDFINTAPEYEISRVLKENAQERYASSIARNIVKERSIHPIETTFDLVNIVKRSMPQKSLKEKGHPAKRTFQAIRIHINSELSNLKKGLMSAFNVLRSGGRIVVITFHSLEDKIVKDQFKKWSTGCTCPGNFPVCVCGKKPLAKVLTKKALKPSFEEVSSNKRSKSAKLRVCEKI